MKRFPKRKSYVVLLTALTVGRSAHAALDVLVGSTTSNGAIDLRTAANFNSPGGTGTTHAIPTAADEAEIPSYYSTANQNIGFTTGS